jgi:hypothetical protein
MRNNITILALVVLLLASQANAKKPKLTEADFNHVGFVTSPNDKPPMKDAQIISTDNGSCEVSSSSVYCKPLSYWELHADDGKVIFIWYDTGMMNLTPNTELDLLSSVFLKKSSERTIELIKHVGQDPGPFVQITIPVHYRVLCAYDVAKSIIYGIGIPYYRDGKFAGEVRYYTLGALPGFSCPLKVKRQQHTVEVK